MISAFITAIKLAKASLTNKASDVLVTMERFVRITQLVIDNLESGYYHPDMKRHMSLADQKVMADSGETMFGIDRKHGADPLASYSEWDMFWRKIDMAEASKKWPHYYLGGPLRDELRSLAAKIMYRWFSTLSRKYISSQAAAVIAQDQRLIIHFSYACWNGAGWFARFSVALNDAVKKFPGNKEAIFQEAIKARTESKNSTIRKQAVNMLKLFSKLPG